MHIYCFLYYKMLAGGSVMNKLKIPQNHSGISRTLRLPENIVDEVQNLADMKNLSFNKTVSILLEFGLNNLEETDRLFLESLSKKSK